MITLTTIIIIALGILLLGLGVYLVLILFREEDERFEDNVVLNFMPQFSTPNKGHAIGMEVETKKIGNRFLVSYQPRDVNKRLLKDKDKLENVSVAVDSNKILSLPTGTLSGYRNIKILLPPNPEDFSDSLKHTLFGQKLMELTEEINGANVESRIVREGSNRKTKLLNEIGDGEISEEFIERQRELQKELDKQKNDGKNIQAPSSFRPPSSNPMM